MKHSASNAAYLKKITDKLSAAPLFIAKRAALYTFTTLVRANLSEGFDSGQAAANWKIEGYTGTPSFAPQVMMWGYGDVSPTAPVGYKSYYSGYKKGSGKGGEAGNPDTVQSYQIEQAVTELAMLQAGVTGITVYNPISPGFGGFTPGEDEFYEENALRGPKKIMQAAAEVALRMAEDEASKILGQKNANFS